LNKTLKRPDYTLVFRGQELLFEVKEFRATPEDFRTGGQLERLEAVAGPQKSAMRRIAEESERSRQQTKVRARE
jgi:hypothetical protein